MTRWLSLLLLLAPLLASAELYRWVDAEGRVHFGDRQPDDGTGDAEQVQVEPPKPIGQGNDLKQINERLEALREKDRERQKAQQQEAAKQEQARKKKCQEQRKRYNRLKGNFVYEKEDGTVYQVSRDQAERDRAELREWLAKHCPED